MASRQEFKEDRAEVAAKLADKDIGDVNREREREQGFNLNSELNFKQARAEAASKLAAKDLEDVNRTREQHALEEEAKRRMEEVRVQQDRDYYNRSNQAPRNGTGEKLVIEVDALGEADEVTSQAMNDVGRMDEKGVIRVERREKM